MRSAHQQKHKLPESASVVASSTSSTSSTSSSYFAEEASKHGLTTNRHVLLAELSVWSTYIIQVEAGQKGKAWQTLLLGPGVAKCWHEHKLTDTPNTSSTKDMSARLLPVIPFLASSAVSAVCDGTACFSML